MKTDFEIREDVLEEIRWDPKLTKLAPQIGVSVKNQVVTLSGVVDHYYQRVAAENAAQRVGGVKVVAMDIEVKGADTSDSTSDAGIAEAIQSALTWHSGVNEDLIDIKVDNGWVYLEGRAHWDYERKAAERAIENIKGVKGIINRIAVHPITTEAREIKKQIGAAFHRSASIDASNISVKVEGTTVELTGKVGSLAERKQAEAVAFSMPGITAVENKLQIRSELVSD